MRHPFCGDAATRLTDTLAMRYDDPAVFWDMPGFFYDMPEQAEHYPKRTMAKPKLNLRALEPLQKIQKANDIVTAMTGNTAYTTPIPALATVTTKSDALSAAISALQEAQTILNQRVAELEVLETDLDALLTALMAYVESASAGDQVKILSAGFEVRGQPIPAGAMPQVIGLDVRTDAMEGRLLPRWESIKGAKSYEAQICTDPITGAGWVAAGITTKASITLDGLPSGSRRWVRVRAIGASGAGPWSDPSIKTVP